MNQLRIIICACLLLAWFPVSGSDRSFGKDAKMTGVMAPLYVKDQPEPSAIIRVGRIFSDYQRKGYFRIGVLPMLVAEDVRIELLHSARVTESLEGAQGWMDARATKNTMEWRRLSLFVPGQATPCLQAGKMQWNDRGQWRLFDVEIHQGSKPLRLATAYLQVIGKEAGRLSWTSDKPESLFLLPLNPN